MMQLADRGSMPRHDVDAWLGLMRIVLEKTSPDLVGDVAKNEYHLKKAARKLVADEFTEYVMCPNLRCNRIFK